MLDARIYRAGLVPVLLAVILCAFSLESRPRPIGTTLAPDAFQAARAAEDLDVLARGFPRRRPGDAADAALGARLADVFRAIPGFSVRTPSFAGHTLDGERTLTTVMARQVGAPAPQLVVVAHRDAAAGPAEAELSGTAAMLELARVVSEGRLRRTVTFVSTSGGSGGAAGARDLVRRLVGPVDAVLVLANLAGRDVRKPFVVGFSDGRGQAPLRLRRTVEAAVRAEAGTDPGGPRATTQFNRQAFPHTFGEQGVLLEAGLPAVLLSVTGERPPPADAPVSVARMESFGRAALRSLVALDNGPDIASELESGIVTVRKVLPLWAIRLLVAALLLPVLLATIDGFARVRRRGEAVGPWIAWILVAALPFLVTAAFAWGLARVGLIDAAPRAPVPVGEQGAPLDRVAFTALGSLALAFLLAWIGVRPLILRALGVRSAPQGPGAGAAVLLVLCAVAVALCVANPYAAAFLVLPAHLWLVLATRGVRVRRTAAFALVVLSLAPFAFATMQTLSQLGLDPAEAAWWFVLLVAGGHVGLLSWLAWSVVAGCLLAVVVLAWRGPAPQRQAPRTTSLRGPVSYAGPGSLGGTESALRR